VVCIVASDLITRVNVIDQNIFGLELDGDGIGCETYPHSNESGLNQPMFNPDEPDEGASHGHVKGEICYLPACKSSQLSS